MQGKQFCSTNMSITARVMSLVEWAGGHYTEFLERFIIILRVWLLKMFSQSVANMHVFTTH